ncbi:MAG TPA: hypothetical protein VKU38_12485 [Ktedonobacteraceae bacterium]|nr:hypothetical protein [Ktedonobacteraceae bacterium]
MANRFSARRTGNIFSCIWQAGILFLLLGTSLSACGITLFSSNCSGVSVSCGNNGTVLAPDATSQVHAAATVTTIKKSKPLASDPMSRQDSNLWGDDAYCSFHDHAYFVEYSSSTQGTYVCDSSRLHFGDAAIQIDVTASLSDESAGIIFRADPSLSDYYDFAISQGQYALAIFGNNTTTTLIPPTSNGAIHGTREKNRLLVITKGNDIKLFINGVFVGETHDSTLTTGYVGVSLTNYISDAQASFSNLVIYRA